MRNDLWHDETESKILVRAKSIYRTVRSLMYLTGNGKTQGEVSLKESKQGRMADALALGGDEGRDKLR